MKISISAIAIWKQQPDRTTEIKYQILQTQLRASPAGLGIWPWENISHIQVLLTYFFPTPPISLKMGVQIGGRLLIATHLDQSNYLANQKQGAVNKYDLTVFIKLSQGSSRALKAMHFFRVTAVFQWLHWAVPHRRFSVQGHILSAGGDALSEYKISKYSLSLRTTNIGYQLPTLYKIPASFGHEKRGGGGRAQPPFKEEGQGPKHEQGEQVSVDCEHNGIDAGDKRSPHQEVIDAVQQLHQRHGQYDLELRHRRSQFCNRLS